MSGFLRRLSDLLFPSRCIFCGALLSPGTWPCICDQCGLLTRRLEAVCPKCGAVPGRDGQGRLRCHTCKSAGRYYDVAFSAYRYSGNVRKAILRYKFHSRVETAGTLAYEPAQLARRVGFNSSNIDYIIYIPPDKKRLHMRGYDHVRLIAQEVSAATGIPLNSRLLFKKKATETQSSLSRRGRALNVRGVYGVLDGVSLHGLKLLLIDDVLTTGSTANEASRVLKRAGAEYVAVLTVAYTAR